LTPSPSPLPRFSKFESGQYKRINRSDDPPKRRFRTLLLTLIAFILALVAMAQTIFFLRTEIATRLPQTEPWLIQACKNLGCIVELPHQIDLLVIDDSSLQEDTEHDGIVILNSTLSNRGHYAQAYPQLELTLTDLEDHTVLRKTFAPVEYLTKGTNINAGLSADEEVHVKLSLSTSTIKAAGYRVFITYP